MSLRSVGSLMLLLLCLGLSGCHPPAEGVGDEQNNPHYKAGKDRRDAFDYKGAIASFERALEDNPRSVLAHFELGVLFEQHESDYAAALYHYGKALKLRPNAYPADNIRQRIPACRQELVKADSLAVLNPNVLRETERLREENQKLLKEVEALRAQLVAHPLVPSPAQPTAAAVTPNRTNRPSTLPFSPPPSPVETGRSVPGQPRLTTLPPRPVATAASPRTHLVRSGETPSAIARQHRISLTALLAANPRLDPKRMKAGQTINLP